jgi:dienelactone hydrolase
MDEAGSDSAIDESGKIPAAAFFSNPLFYDVRLSPNGRRIAVLISRGETDVLMSIDLKTGEKVPLASLERKEAVRYLAGHAIDQVGWASEDIVVMTMSHPVRGPGFIRREMTMVSSDVRDPQPRDLSENWPFVEYMLNRARVISFLPDDPDRLLVNWFGDPREVEIKFSRLRASELQKAHVYGWEVDHEFKVRIGYSAEQWSSDFEVWGRISDEDPIERLVKWDPLDPEETGLGFDFAGFSEKPEMIYVFSERETGRYALYEYDLRTRKLGRRVFENPEYGVGFIRTSKVDGRLLAVGYIADAPVIHYVDPESRRLWQPIHHDFEGMDVQLITMDRHERSSIFTVSADDSPPVYYLLDHRTGKYSKLFRARPALDGQTLSKTEPVHFRARDGLEIHGYVTRPANAHGPTATIVIPNHFAFSRSNRTWDPVVQFFASRGFTVFQLNHRGSTGYGRKFREAGYQQLGRGMQDDITDGVKWLIQEKIADPGRIGIFGIGYGGYAALQGLASTPDLFAAGGSYAGISDLSDLLVDYQGGGFSIAANEALIGSRWSDHDSLRAASPVFHANAIKAPVLLGHGTDDWNHNIRHSDEMASALDAAGVEYEYYRYRGESHRFLDERTRIDFFQKAGAFFEKHLRPDPANIRPPVEVEKKGKANREAASR